MRCGFYWSELTGITDDRRRPKEILLEEMIEQVFQPGGIL